MLEETALGSAAEYSLSWRLVLANFCSSPEQLNDLQYALSCLVRVI